MDIKIGVSLVRLIFIRLRWIKEESKSLNINMFFFFIFFFLFFNKCFIGWYTSKRENEIEMSRSLTAFKLKKMT